MRPLSGHGSGDHVEAEWLGFPFEISDGALAIFFFSSS